jgi:UDPglucose 6-dehydrogenase
MAETNSRDHSNGAAASTNGHRRNGRTEGGGRLTIGIVGLGKLGLPVAAAIGRHHEVIGYDVRPEAMQPPRPPHREEGLVEAWPTADVKFGSLADVVERCNPIFIAVQTPHEPLYEGITRLPDERADFDYTHLCDAVETVDAEIHRQGRARTVVIISTVLPGTTARHVSGLCGPLVTLAYNPAFIAMGTTIRDFLDPEFVLLGGDREGVVEAFYRSIVDAPIYRTSIENAELVKVAYNTFIGLKLAFANTLMEVCHKSPGCDVDEVTGALKLAHRRLISPAYLSGGMGDGGGCHPRDNIALSWLARELGLSYDLFESAMLARERQADWLVDLVCEHDLPTAILGLAFKAGTDLVTGSPAALCRRLLEERGREPVVYDERCGMTPAIDGPHVFLVGARHPEHPDFPFPEGSVVIDPWRYIPERDGMTVIPVGADGGPRTAGGNGRVHSGMLATRG